METLQREWCDEATRYIDFLVQFREVARVDGEIRPTGELSRIYGWVWDRDAEQADGSVGGWADDVDSVSLDRVHVLDCNPMQFGILCDDEHEHILIVGSRGSSKSETAARWQAKKIATSPRAAISAIVAKRKKARRFVEKKLLPLLPEHWLAGDSRRAGETGYRRSTEEISLTFRHRCLADFLSAKVPDDARADDMVAALIDEAQLCPAEARENLILSGRRSEGAGNRLPIQTLETATLLAGEFEDYVARASKDPSYRVVELSITDNIHLETVYDEVTGCNLPPLVIWARNNQPKGRFEQEIGVWDEVNKRFHPIAEKQTGLVWCEFSKTNVERYAVHTATETIRRVLSSIHPDVGHDITPQTVAARFRKPAEEVFGVAFEPLLYTTVVGRWFSTPAGMPPLLWITDEVGVDEANARELARRAKDQGHANAAAVPDAGGRYSEGGKTSLAYFRAEGFQVRGPAKNSKMIDVINKVNGKLRNAAGIPTLLVDPRCVGLLACLRGQRRTPSSGDPAIMENHEQNYGLALGYLVDYFTARADMVAVEAA